LIARAIRPGQFVNLVCGPALDPLLPRPFSVFRVDGEVLELLVQVVGRGTARLSELRTGDDLDCFGPLGRGFRVPHGRDVHHIMVAGGIGVAPFYALGKVIRSAPGLKALLYGAATKRHLVCLREFREACMRVETMTVKDGPRKGFVTRLLEDYLERTPGPWQLYACGPTPMLKAVWALALARGIPCQLSLETPMACGMGLCKGCSFPRRGAEGFTLTCREGPVYEAAAIDFDHPAVAAGHA
jgi:dihydroorotate dehydrogenase electron transfer subunit